MMGFNTRIGTCALLGLMWITLQLSDCLQTSVRPNKDSTVTVFTEADDCSVCSSVDSQTTCNSSLTLVAELDVDLLLNCSRPEAFSASITQSIRCSADACSPATVETQTFGLLELARTFTWQLEAPENVSVGLDLLGEGLKETNRPCSNGFRLTVVSPGTSGQRRTHYCRGGSVTHFDLQDRDQVSLKVPPKEQVLLQTSAGPLKGRSMDVTVDSSTTLVISRTLEEPEANCDVCSVDGCSAAEKTLTDQKLSLQFSCQKPEDLYRVEVKKTIECSQNSCSPATGGTDPDLFMDFTRTLSWDVRVPERTILTLVLTGYKLKKTSAADQCPDGFQFSVRTAKSDGTVRVSRFCREGTESRLELLGVQAVTVEVPKGTELAQDIFTVTAAPRAGRKMTVSLDPNTSIMLWRMDSEVDCSVCMSEAHKQKCLPNLQKVNVPRNSSVEFTCPRPQDVFSVEINREIACTETSCSADVVQAKSSLFLDFNRTFTWDSKVIFTRTFQLDFPEAGMRQIPNQETCPDDHTYSMISYLRGMATVGTFCSGGTVTSVQIRFSGRVSLQVPGGTELQPVDFKVSVGPETHMAAIVKVDLPRGVSETDFMSPNYPADLPDQQQVQWNFSVPGMHNYSMLFLDHSTPECLSQDVLVEYQKDQKVTRLSLADPQPQHQQGNFNLLLHNCKTNRTLPGLRLKLRVSVMRSGHPVVCPVEPAVSLQIEKVSSDPYCELRIDSRVQQKINVAAGSKASVSFLDCTNEDLRLTASDVIGCRNVTSCSPTQLVLPKLDPCLPMPLHSFTWQIRIPADGTVDLVSPSGRLQQALPGQSCGGSAKLHLSESGSPVGEFCSGGDIRKVQLHANVSVTATCCDFRSTTGPILNVSFSPEIKETIIYRVQPTSASPTLLATPNWPAGMRPSSIVSWIVSVPNLQQVQLRFTNVSQPKCATQHTYVKVKLLGHEEETMSRREDEQVEEELLLPYSFYLNMSNCVPEEGQFSVVASILLQNKTNVLAIVLGTTAAVLLLLLVLLIAVCVTRKKKKEKGIAEASIYMGKGSIFRPGDRTFIKTRSENESHVYASIDESMVYGHLLPDSSYASSVQDHFKPMPVDSYHTFMGPAEGDLPVNKKPDPEPETDQYRTFLDPSDTFIPARPRTPIDRQDSLGFQDRRMVDNELYTFKSTGDINPIRLSGADQDPPVNQVSEDYL